MLACGQLILEVSVHLRSFIATCLVLTLFVGTPAFAAGPPNPTASYPPSVTLVPVAAADTIQQVLDSQGAVRLEDADYSSAPAITLRSGQQLYGLGASGPVITIEPGANGVVLSNIRPARLEFPASSLVTHHNLFFEIGGDVVAIGATLEENVFLGLENGTIHIDNTNGGWAKNNRFIRIRAHALKPLLTMKGDPQLQSTGNVFLWGNQLTQPEGMVDIRSQAQVSFVGWDDEAYADITTDPIYRFEDIGTLRMWSMNGASTTTTMPLFDIDATDLLMVNVTMISSHPTRIVLRPGVENAFWMDAATPMEDQNPTGVRIGSRTGQNNNTGSSMDDHGGALTVPLPADSGAALHSLFDRPSVPWERPTFGPEPDPAGPDWRLALPTATDSTAAIQAQIDANETVVLGPGVHYISAPLKFHSGTKIIGSGVDVTAIVALDPSIDMIIDSGTESGTRARFQILDLTLQGGTNGVHLFAEGDFRQYSVFLLSNVAFRDFSNAGFFIDQIFGLDNGLLHNVDFIGNSTGFKQYVDRTADPAGSNSGYMDKVTFHHNRFLRNGIGADLPAHRANNLDSFISSLFQDNTDRAVFATSANDMQLVNSDFINNGGTPSVMGVTDVISCYFRSDERGIAMLGGRELQIEGSRFEAGTSTTGKVFENSADTFFAANNAWANFSFAFMANSTSDGMDLGNIQFGVFMNNELGARPDLSKPSVFAWQGDVTVIVDGAVEDPTPQLLTGVSFAEDTDPDLDAGTDSDAGFNPGADAGPGTTDAGPGTIDAGNDLGTSAQIPTGEDDGCGCSSSGDAGLPWLAVFGLFFLVRRRR